MGTGLVAILPPLTVTVALGLPVPVPTTATPSTLLTLGVAALELALGAWMVIHLAPSVPSRAITGL
jgi:hypothetical protein